MSKGENSYFDPLVLARLSNLYLKARWIVEGIMAGIHRSRSKGFSVEFEEHREYSPGDEIRRIDWKALGKFDRYFIKETEDETNLKAYIVLDTSASMDYSADGITKFDYSCILAASLSYLILKQHDAVGILTFSDKIESFIPPKSSRSHLIELLQALEKSSPFGKTSVGKTLQEAARKISRRGIVILISDLLDETEAVLNGLRLFRFKGNDVIVFHILDNSELELPFNGNILFEDIEKISLKVSANPQVIRSDYRKVIREHIDQIKSSCRENSIDYQLLPTSTPLDHALVSYLCWRG